MSTITWHQRFYVNRLVLVFKYIPVNLAYHIDYFRIFHKSIRSRTKSYLRVAVVERMGVAGRDTKIRVCHPWQNVKLRTFIVRTDSE